MTIRQVGPDQFLAEIPMTVPYAAPAREYLLLKDEIDDAMAEVLESGRYVGGKVVEAFESEIAAYLGVKHVVAVKSGTEAIALVRGAFHNEMPGMVTHWDGLIYPTIPVYVEDAAQAFGSRLQGYMAGTLGIAACFSLHPLKTFSVQGGGGLVSTNDDWLMRRVRDCRGHGLDALQCAVGRVKLRYIDGFLKRKQEIARRYAAELPEGCRRPDYDYPSNYPVPDNGLRKQLADRGVETIPGNFANTINLPLFPELTEEEISHVIASVRESRAAAPAV